MAERFYCIEVEGYLTPRFGSPKAKGLTVTVHDRAYLHRAVALYRSEDYQSQKGHRGYVGNVETRHLARTFAEAECARLNKACPEGWPAA